MARFDPEKNGGLLITTIRGLEAGLDSKELDRNRVAAVPADKTGPANSKPKSKSNVNA